jgi:vitamin B12 transporter
MKIRPEVSHIQFLKYIACILVLVSCPLFHTAAQEQDTLKYRQPAVLVTATRSPVPALSVNRAFDVIERTTFEALPATSIGDAIQQYASVNIQSRGTFGMQTDLSIRGSLFSQNLVLLNGTRLDDPQTAHHNFDLPVTLEQVERIEILRGPSSAQYGANAFGGIINIITRKPEASSAAVHLSGGNYGLTKASGEVSSVWPGVTSSNNISYSQSDGYRYDTDFSSFNLSSSNEFKMPSGSIDLFAGFTKKEFGAFDFYSPGRNKPSKEWTETSCFSVGSTIAMSFMQLKPKITYRRHLDRFMDDIRTPDMNVNVHATNVIQSELVGIMELKGFATMTAGSEWSRDDISSNVYGRHERNSGALFTSLNSRFNQWILDAGVRADFHSVYGWQVSPTIGAGYIFIPQAKLYITCGRSFRAPTYTELYLNNPNFIGDPLLHPETGWSYETGFEYFPASAVQLSLSLFDHDQRNLIDYVKYSSADRYHAENFTKAVTRGVEFSTHWSKDSESAEFSAGESPALEQVLFAYSYLDSYIAHDPVYATRYSLMHPRHQVSLTVIGSLPFNVRGSVGIIHKIKLTGIYYTLVDARFIKYFSMFDLYISGTNLLNQSYEEIAGVPLPGRWLWAGIDVRFL